MWSCIFLIALVIAFLYYFYYYFLKISPDVTTSLLTLDEYPALHLGEANFFASFTFREEGAFRTADSYDKTWFRIHAALVTETHGTSGARGGDAPTTTRTEIKVANCNEANIDASIFSGKTDGALHGESSCLEFGPKDEL